MATEHDTVTKLPKLNSSKDYLHWKRRVYAYLRREDFELLCFREEPEDATSAQKRKWLKAMVEAKSSIILTLGSSPLAQLSDIIDDDERTAKELWDAVIKLYTTSNAQAIINLEQELEGLRFDDGQSWEKHTDNFHNILGKLSSYDSAIKEEDKASKLLRTLPESFAPLAMVAQTNDLSLEKVIAAVEGELSRRKMKTSEARRPSNPLSAHQSSIPFINLKPSQSNINKNTKNPKPCFVCGKNGHFADKCWYRFDGARGRGRGSSRVFSHRGRGLRRGSFRGGANSFTTAWPSPDSQPPGSSHHDQANSGWGLSRHDSRASYPPQSNFNSKNGQGNGNGFSGFMAKIKYRSTLAQCEAEKDPNVLIDSGGSHHFFYARSSFKTYKEVPTEKVRGAAGFSTIVGKGEVVIPIDGGLTVEAFHTPFFSSNILSVGELSFIYDIFFKSEALDERRTSFCVFKKQESGEVVFRKEIEDGLYSLKMPTSKGTSNEIRYQSPECATCVQASLEDKIDKAYEWHKKLGHPSAERFITLMKSNTDIPKFSPSTVQSIFCHPCSVSKSKRAPVRTSSRSTVKPLELIHLDILGPMPQVSIGGRRYAIGIVDDWTAKSDVIFLSEKGEIHDAVQEYMHRSERVTGYRLQNIRLDGAGENRSDAIKSLQSLRGIYLEYSPRYASESNGVVERFMQELGLRSRLFLKDSGLQESLWAEAMAHGNWLRNRLPSSRVSGAIPMTIWKPNTRLSFSRIPFFGQHGYAFIYRPKTIANKKLLARSVHSRFIGMQSDERLCRVYVSTTNEVMILRLADFRPCSQEQLPSVNTLLDGLSRQASEE